MLTYAFLLEKVKTVDFSETIAADYKGTSGGKYAINFAVKNSVNKSLITLQKILEVCRETYIVLRYWIYLNSSVSCVKTFSYLEKIIYAILNKYR